MVVKSYLMKFWKLKGKLLCNMTILCSILSSYALRIVFAFSKQNQWLYWESHLLLPNGVRLSTLLENGFSLFLFGYISQISYLFFNQCLANLIDESVCFDEATMRKDRLGYARALIEVKPNRLLPSILSVELAFGLVVMVDIGYKWKPPIYTNSKSFVHLVSISLVPCQCQVLRMLKWNFLSRRRSHFQKLWSLLGFLNVRPLLPYMVQLQVALCLYRQPLSLALSTIIYLGIL